MADDRLITLSAERIAAELRAVAQAEAAARMAHHQLLLLGAEVVGSYLAGPFLVGVSFHSTDPALARYPFVLGLLVAGIAPIVVGYAGWRSQNA